MIPGASEPRRDVAIQPHGSVPRVLLRSGPSLQSGPGQASGDTLEALPAEVRTGLARMENQRKQGAVGDAVAMFAVPAAPLLWWRNRWQQVRATDVPGHLAQSTPVRAYAGELEAVRDLITSRSYKISTTRSRGYVELNDLAALTLWVRNGAQLPEDGDACGRWCRLLGRLAQKAKPALPAPSRAAVAISAETRMALTRMDNRRTRASEGDVAHVFMERKPNVFGFIQRWSRIDALDVPARVRAGASVSVSLATMHEATMLFTGEPTLTATMHRGSVTFTSVAALERWIADGARV